MFKFQEETITYIYCKKKKCNFIYITEDQSECVWMQRCEWFYLIRILSRANSRAARRFAKQDIMRWWGLCVLVLNSTAFSTPVYGDLITFQSKIRNWAFLCTLLLLFCLFTFYGDVVHVCKTEMKSNFNKAFLSLEVQCVSLSCPDPCAHVLNACVCVQSTVAKMQKIIHS